ncbi:hypothetical protein FKR81_01830 [Lentzea tibetensis]|uniref:Putative heavy-metal chelation domain-containing protein n=1 Tax=Lentzea tibetensis TaxID=2591470 RepID=A0A563F315_9PSEU|nr:DUF364 domain-containing protein [Lentzea tibetensis]TWP54319.1 hypothetical protein FKR81_01830 [Lentzea tibetensis]
MPATVAELMESVTADDVVTSAFWLHNTTRLAGADVTYRNHYAVVRLGTSFGACAFEDGQLDPDVCASISGRTVTDLLRTAPLPVRVAVLDAQLAERAPHRESAADHVYLPVGTPEERAAARDEAIAGLLGEEKRVGLIGVVNPLVAAIEARGGECLPCDLNLRETAWGKAVTPDMHEVLDVADAIVATGMTLSNGSFDTILRRCREREIPLVIYAQTGSAVAREFLGSGVTALCAEPFPFSQFSAELTTVYCYRSET